jgi:hypothetical protein
MSLQKQYLKELASNPYARARFDSVIIDAKNESSKPRSPLAVAHKMNHPPSGTPPNVIGFAFEFPPEGTECSSILSRELLPSRSNQRVLGDLVCRAVYDEGIR